jgi:hypothetical protein
MKQPQKIRRIGLLLLTLTLLGALLAFSTNKTQAQTTNKLVNPGFEDPFSSGVANNWAPWHEDQGKKECGTSVVKPTWFAERNGALILAGGTSQGVGNQFDTWRGGVFQTIGGLTPGATYRFTFSGRLFASNSNFGTAPSDGVGIMRAGIDPNGSGLWYEADVVWSGAIAPHGAFQQVSVETVATGDKVTVYTEARFVNNDGYCAAHLDAWFESAELIEVGSSGGSAPPPAPANTPAPAPVVVFTPGPTPTPDAEGVIYFAVPAGGSLWSVAAEAGITLDELLDLNNLTRDSFVRAGDLLIVGYAEPSATATPEVTPTAAEALPTEAPPTATAEPTSPSGGVICANAFGDLDGSGQREASEGYMAGVTFTLTQGDAILGQGVSRGVEEAVCFENIPPGTYQVAQVLPSSLETTTASSIDIELNAGQQIRLEFGSRVRSAGPAEEVAEAATAVPQATTAPAGADDGGLGITAISGLILIVVAILLLGGMILLIARQRA